jgi:5-amino-6-(5-phosphoribosylamino)uracil reductase
LSDNCVDELQVSIAPFFVGDKDAPHMVNPGKFPFGINRPMQLQKVESFEGMVLLTYSLHAKPK